MNGIPSSTYFSTPPEWGWLIVFYFFFGGLAGGCYFLGALIDLFSRPEDRPLARLGYYISFPCMLISGLLLTLDLTRPLGFQVVVAKPAAELPERHGGYGTGQDRCRHRSNVRERRVHVGLLPRLAERATQTQRIEPRRLREERLIRDDPADAGLRVVDALEVRAERAVLVRAQRAGDEQAVAERRRFLDVEAERLLERDNKGPRTGFGTKAEVLKKQ